MDILDELTHKFSELLDAELTGNLQNYEVSAKFNEFCEQLPPKQSEELDEIVGKMLSANFNSAVKAGMKLGAKIAIGLLIDDS
ncbi:MAG: hypothetical protein V3G42_15715 [Oscillospiraceae bacterium]